MFDSVLIANRGEIACRIARTAKRLGMRSIAVFSAADANALHVRMCDEAYPIGAAPARDSYLAIGKLIDVAKRSKAGCVHPGYGFLSENADFAEACAAAGTTFVGPPAEAIRAMGRKDYAKMLMERAHVPIVPGYHGDRQDVKFLKEKAYEIGYPVLLKPAGGGGGRGLRRVDRHADFEAALEGSMREAEAAFGSSRVLIEKYVASPRHIEIQVFADAHDNVIHLGERDCSLQRRHQKVVEEAPAPGMTAELRSRIGSIAVEAARAVGYRGAGTVEFIADGSGALRADGIWFIEMNTRLQVEHPVTEAITGLDLVEWQFRVADGQKLPQSQNQIRLDGHAIEARIYAEDTENGFLPSTGRIVAFQLPHEVRVDSGVETGGEVTPYYDAMVAKMIAHAPTRSAALNKLADALDRTVIAGPRTNTAFLAALCRTREFSEGTVDTGFIDRNLAALGAVKRDPDNAAAAVGVARLLAVSREGHAHREAANASASGWVSPWAAQDGFQLGGRRSLSVPIVLDGQNAVALVRFGKGSPSVSVDETPAADDVAVFEADGEAFVLRDGRQTRVKLRDFSAGTAESGAGDGVIKAPMHGRVLSLLVGTGEEVRRGQRLAVIEAMKMEHTLHAPFAGKVSETFAAVGDQVVEGAKIMLIAAVETN